MREYQPWRGGSALAPHRWFATPRRVDVRRPRDHAAMRATAIRAGDIVHANKRGRLFHAKVISAGVCGTLVVEPIERNISYRHLEASEITAHWSRHPPVRPAPRPARRQELSLPV